jgi:pyridoxamine 5'-phosphate oxidase
MDAAAQPPDVAAMRRAYAAGGLREADCAPDPLAQFARWFADALVAALPEPNAMVLATTGAGGRPSARTVLLKGYDELGFTFFTHGRSRKGRELAENPWAALLFPWHPLERQVRVEGPCAAVDPRETARYFASRPRESQLGAWASEQSAVIPDREALERRYAEAAERFPAGAPVPVPPGWTGFRVRPEAVEFWQGREGRLHDRLRYRRAAGRWVLERLAP